MRQICCLDEISCRCSPQTGRKSKENIEIVQRAVSQGGGHVLECEGAASTCADAKLSEYKPRLVGLL
jgi:hypothetical protein